VENRTIPGRGGPIRVRVYRPRGARGTIAYFHGGGWVIGDLDSHDETCRRLAVGANAVVVSVDYRRAPETPYPGAVHDCYDATEWVAANPEFPEPLAVAGDSAGGNLAAATALMARDEGGPDLAFQLLIYPVTDTNFDTASYAENAEGYLLTRRAMQWFWDHYAPEIASREEPYCAPLRSSDLSGLPPAFVMTAEFDPLRDEGEAYARALEEAGNIVTLRRYNGLIHGFFGMQDAIPAARPAFDQALAALRRHLR
jgi:acetyl esterase